jgi:hypothetical protein
MQRLARAVAAGGFAFAQHDAETTHRAGDRRSTARGPAANDNYIGIDRSVIHEPSSRRKSTMLSDT